MKAAKLGGEKDAAIISNPLVRHVSFRCTEIRNDIRPKSNLTLPGCVELPLADRGTFGEATNDRYLSLNSGFPNSDGMR